MNARHCLPVLALAVLVVTPARAGLYEFELHLHAEPGIASDMFDSAGDPVSEAAPGGALLPVVSDALNARPAGAEWDFTGTISGSNLWVLPKNGGSGILFLGIGAEEIDPADLAGSITLTFQGLCSPCGTATRSRAPRPWSPVRRVSAWPTLSRSLPVATVTSTTASRPRACTP
jgi:hypothetical protein